MQPHEFIDRFEDVIARFGQWPSFHDAEVHRLVLDRTTRSPAGSYIPSVEVHIRGWIMGPDVTNEGYYRKHNDSVVLFRFEDIFDLEVEGFNQQNVLSSLNLALIEDPKSAGQVLRVELEHCYLFSGAFTARRAKILSVVPYASQ